MYTSKTQGWLKGGCLWGSGCSRYEVTHQRAKDPKKPQQINFQNGINTLLQRRILQFLGLLRHGERRGTFTTLLWGGGSAVGKGRADVRTASPTVNKVLTDASGLVLQIRILRHPNHRENLCLPANSFPQAFTECLGIVKTGQGRARELTKIPSRYTRSLLNSLQQPGVKATWQRKVSLGLNSCGLEHKGERSPVVQLCCRLGQT